MGAPNHGLCWATASSPSRPSSGRNSGLEPLEQLRAHRADDAQLREVHAGIDHPGQEDRAREFVHLRVGLQGVAPSEYEPMSRIRPAHRTPRRHRLIIGEINAEATGDLLRAPALSPAPVFARSVTPPAPADRRARNAPVGALHSSGEPVLHIATQLRVDRQLRRLGSSGTTVSMRLGGRGPILRPAGADRSVPPQLSGDRRRRTTELTRDRAHPRTTSSSDRLPEPDPMFPPSSRRTSAATRPCCSGTI